MICFSPPGQGRVVWTTARGSRLNENSKGLDAICILIVGFSNLPFLITHPAFSFLAVHLGFFFAASAAPAAVTARARPAMSAAGRVAKVIRPT